MYFCIHCWCKFLDLVSVHLHWPFRWRQNCVQPASAAAETHLISQNNFSSPKIFLQIIACPWSLANCSQSGPILSNPFHYCSFSNCQAQSCFTDIRNLKLKQNCIIALKSLDTCKASAVLKSEQREVFIKIQVTFSIGIDLQIEGLWRKYLSFYFIFWSLPIQS